MHIEPIVRCGTIEERKRVVAGGDKTSTLERGTVRRMVRDIVHTKCIVECHAIGGEGWNKLKRVHVELSIDGERRKREVFIVGRHTNTIGRMSSHGGHIYAIVERDIDSGNELDHVRIERPIDSGGHRAAIGRNPYRSTAHEGPIFVVSSQEPTVDVDRTTMSKGR
ncbi:hypothetical protein K474DRAFT_1505510 [Panus rudis PR-1116 ss-1]|nr:hypothetical protein K474DRAFT_1505510 [Panus rudis PR-1116 ss-1]